MIPIPPVHYFVNILLEKTPKYIKKIIWGGPGFYCQICEESISRFRPFGDPRRENAWCPLCGSLDRHRQAWLFLKKRSELQEGNDRALLHVAPEPIMERRFRNIPGLNYLSIDLYDPRAMLRASLTDIPRQDKTFSAFYCSHVLEHIPDDRGAISELFRILRPGGIGIVQVPLRQGETLEDPTVVSPEERLKKFGQKDHVRLYGDDLLARLEEAGFDVDFITPEQLVDEMDRKRLGLAGDPGLFFCRRPDEKIG